MINLKTISYLFLLSSIASTSYFLVQKNEKIHGIESYKKIIYEELDSILAFQNRYLKALISLDRSDHYDKLDTLNEADIAELIKYKEADPILFNKLAAIHLVSKSTLSKYLCCSRNVFVKSHTDSLYFGAHVSSRCHGETKFHIDVNGFDMSDVPFNEPIFIPLTDSITITTTKMQIRDKQSIDTTQVKQLLIYQNSDWIESLP